MRDAVARGRPLSLKEPGAFCLGRSCTKRAMALVPICNTSRSSVLADSPPSETVQRIDSVKTGRDAGSRQPPVRRGARTSGRDRRRRYRCLNLRGAEHDFITEPAASLPGMLSQPAQMIWSTPYQVIAKVLKPSI